MDSTAVISRAKIIVTVILTIAVVSSSSAVKSLLIQKGNDHPCNRLTLQRIESPLENRLGGDYGSDFNEIDAFFPLGIKWIRMGFWDSSLNWQKVASSQSIPPGFDRAVSSLSRKGFHIVLNLGVGSGKQRPDSYRFKQSAEVAAYTEYVKAMVHHFKDRIRYYEVWNEPNIDGPWGEIAVADYIRLIRQVSPVIRKEYPQAKIVVGAIGGSWKFGFPGYGQSGRYTFDLDYLKGILHSEIMPEVDVISWHPFYGHRPDDPYWKEYPEMVREIQSVAAQNGFTGEFLAEEMLWRTDTFSDEPQAPVSGMVSAKYLSRAIVMHLGLNVTACMSGSLPGRCSEAVSRLSALLAEAHPISASVSINCVPREFRHFRFSLPCGNQILAVWREGPAVDEDSGVECILSVAGISPKIVEAVDILEGVTQELLFESENEVLCIRGLLLRDYPLLLRLRK